MADCLTALKEDHWGDAVTLFLLPTTGEPTDTRYRLMFLECRSCGDQRAYFWFSPGVDYRIPGAKDQIRALWAEAYKFFDPLRAEEFAKAQKLRGPTPAISITNSIDVHGQTTI